MPLHPEYDAMLKQLAATPGPAISDMPVADARAMYRMMRPAAPDLAVAKVQDRIHSRSGRCDSDAHLHACRQRSIPDPGVLPRRRLGDRRSRNGRCDLARVLPARRLRRRVGGLSARSRTPLSRGGGRQLRGDEMGCRQRRCAERRCKQAGRYRRKRRRNLAAVVSHWRATANGPAIAYQLLAYPVTDADFTTGSYRANADGYLLTLAGMQWFWDTYCPNRSRPNKSVGDAVEREELREAAAAR